MLAGEYPGDGKPEPVVFHDPARTAGRGSPVALDPSVRTKYEEPGEPESASSRPGRC